MKKIEKELKSGGDLDILKAKIMKFYYFNKDITANTITELVDNLQEIDGKIRLYFSTNGGNSDPMTYLVSFLNSRKEDITVVLIDRLCSAGTLILSDFKGVIKMDKGLDFILFHMSDRESFSLRKGGASDKIITQQDLHRNKIFAKKLKKKGFLTDKQLKQYSKGDDVILYRKDFKHWKLLY
jgi:ATP-dependent protease ClpP protease subunit